MFARLGPKFTKHPRVNESGERLGVDLYVFNYSDGFTPDISPCLLPVISFRKYTYLLNDFSEYFAVFKRIFSSFRLVVASGMNEQQHASVTSISYLYGLNGPFKEFNLRKPSMLCWKPSRKVFEFAKDFSPSSCGVLVSGCVLPSVLPPPPASLTRTCSELSLRIRFVECIWRAKTPTIKWQDEYTCIIIYMDV